MDEEERDGRSMVRAVEATVAPAVGQGLDPDDRHEQTMTRPRCGWQARALAVTLAGASVPR
jgi:hypothetical protein